MAEKWVMVRLKEETHARLKQMRDRLEDAYQRSLIDLPYEGGLVSLDEMVARLIRHVDNDQRRKRESKKRVRARSLDK